MSRPQPARALAALLLPLALAACATGPQLRGPLGAAEPSAKIGVRDDATAYGLYLAGEAALDDGDTGRAAEFLRAAAEREPDAPDLRQRAFAAALLSGDVKGAAEIAPSAPASGGKPGAGYALGQLTRAAVDLSAGRDREAYGALAPASMGDHWAAASLVRPWAAAGAGEVGASLEPVSSGQEPAVEAFGELNRAALLERAGRMEAADAAYSAQSSRGGVFALDYGAFLERRGKRADALALYDRALAKDPTDSAFTAARARAAAGRPAPPRPSVRQGAAQALVAPAALLVEQKQPEAALAYLRLALFLDPDLGEAQVLLGDVLEGEHNAAAARAAYARVSPASPEYVTAQSRIALDLQEDGDKAGALAAAQALVASHGEDPHALLVLADLYRDDERYPEAVQALDRLIAKVSPQTAADWRLYYLRGAAEEREGRWPAAQADLQKALALKPADPEIMNYLGFAWADRAERLDEAVQLLQRANALSPDNGAYIDSLGWAYYRQGRYAQAVHELERAASLEPADPDINSHLGDAYWRTGRRLEAQYQWRRVLTLQPDEKTRTAMQDRLSHGLTGVAMAPAARGAQP